MTFRDFLDAAFALVYHEKIRQGLDMNAALEAVAHLGQSDVEDPDAIARRQEEAELRREEAEARRLEAYMARHGMPSFR